MTWPKHLTSALPMLRGANQVIFEVPFQSPFGKCLPPPIPSLHPIPSPPPVEGCVPRPHNQTPPPGVGKQQLESHLFFSESRSGVQVQVQVWRHSFVFPRETHLLPALAWMDVPSQRGFQSLCRGHWSRVSAPGQGSCLLQLPVLPACRQQGSNCLGVSELNTEQGRII